MRTMALETYKIINKLAPEMPGQRAKVKITKYESMKYS
jgi:hypothetical protein